MARDQGSWQLMPDMLSRCTTPCGHEETGMRPGSGNGFFTSSQLLLFISLLNYCNPYLRRPFTKKKKK